MIITETEAAQQAVGPVQFLPERAEPAAPRTSDVLGAAMRVQNTVVSAGRALGDALERRQIQARRTALGIETPEGYSALQDIRGYEPYARAFRDAGSPDEVTAIKRRIDRELEDRAALDSSGAEGVVAQIAAGVLDPINLVPIGSNVSRSVRLGRAMAESAGRTAATGAAVATAAEGILQGTQDTRTAQESAVTIGAAAVLSGVLGAAAPLIRASIPELTGRLQRELTIPHDSTPDPLAPRSVALNATDLPTEGASLGAAAVQRGEAKLKSALGVENVLRFASPMMRAAMSPSVATRRLAQELVETPFYYTDNALGIATPIAVETRVKFWQAPLAEALQTLDDQWIAHQRSNYPQKIASFTEFKEQVGRAMRQEDIHQVPEVEEAARVFRQKVFDPLKEQAIMVQLLPENVKPKGAPSYFTRVYNAAKISARRGEFVDRLTKWLVDDQTFRAGEFDRQVAKLDPFSPARRDLRAVEIFDPLELREAAEDITDNILGVSDGRILYETKDLPRGPLAERVLNAPDWLLDEFLESDIELVSRFYTRTMASDVELARAFGTPDMSMRITEIRDNYKDLIARATTEPERVRLAKQRDADIRDLEAMRDRIRGTYAAPADPTGFFVRAGQTIRNWSYLSLMGSMLVSSIPDLARPVMVNGIMRTLRDGVLPLVTNLKGFKLAVSEAKLAGTALDMVLESRAMELADVGNVYGRHSQFERGLQAVADRFGNWALMNPWNAALKSFSSVITQHNIMRAVLSGDGMTAREIEQLAFGGIDKDMARRIAAQVTEHADRSGTAWVANTRAWTDRQAVKHFRAAVLKDVDRTIVTPGAGDRPLWMSTEMGKVIGQFHTFAFASAQRVLLSGLQQRDMAVLNGTLLATTLGMGIYAMHSKGEKRDLADDPAVWIREGVDRSGILGWLYEAGNIAEKFTRGAIGPRALTGGEVSLRYAERGVFGALFGPSVGRVEDIAKATGSSVSGEFSESDVRSLRRLIPFQNLFYLRWLFDKAQEGAAEALVD